jgi:hypothetical protein
MLIKDIVVGMVVVYEDKRMEIREDTVIYEDGVEISRTSYFYMVMPGDKIEDKPKMVRDIAGAIWTPEMIKARFDKLKEPFTSPIPTLPIDKFNELNPPKKEEEQ